MVAVSSDRVEVPLRRGIVVSGKYEIGVHKYAKAIAVKCAKRKRDNASVACIGLQLCLQKVRGSRVARSHDDITRPWSTGAPLMSPYKPDTTPRILKLPEAFKTKIKSFCRQIELLRTTIALMLTSGFFDDMRMRFGTQQLQALLANDHRPYPSQIQILRLQSNNAFQ